MLFREFHWLKKKKQSQTLEILVEVISLISAVYVWPFHGCTVELKNYLVGKNNKQQLTIKEWPGKTG